MNPQPTNPTSNACPVRFRVRLCNRELKDDVPTVVRASITRIKGSGITEPIPSSSISSGLPHPDTRARVTLSDQLNTTTPQAIIGKEFLPLTIDPIVNYTDVSQRFSSFSSSSANPSDAPLSAHDAFESYSSPTDQVLHNRGVNGRAYHHGTVEDYIISDDDDDNKCDDNDPDYRPSVSPDSRPKRSTTARNITRGAKVTKSTPNNSECVPKKDKPMIEAEFECFDEEVDTIPKRRVRKGKRSKSSLDVVFEDNELYGDDSGFAGYDSPLPKKKRKVVKRKIENGDDLIMTTSPKKKKNNIKSSSTTTKKKKSSSFNQHAEAFNEDEIEEMDNNEEYYDNCMDGNNPSNDDYYNSGHSIANVSTPFVGNNMGSSVVDVGQTTSRISPFVTGTNSGRVTTANNASKIDNDVPINNVGSSTTLAVLPQSAVIPPPIRTHFKIPHLTAASYNVRKNINNATSDGLLPALSGSQNLVTNGIIISSSSTDCNGHSSLSNDQNESNNNIDKRLNVDFEGGSSSVTKISTATTAPKISKIATPPKHTPTSTTTTKIPSGSSYIPLSSFIIHSASVPPNLLSSPLSSNISSSYSSASNARRPPSRISSLTASLLKSHSSIENNIKSNSLLSSSSSSYASNTLTLPPLAAETSNGTLSPSLSKAKTSISNNSNNVGGSLSTSSSSNAYISNNIPLAPPPSYTSLVYTPGDGLLSSSLNFGRGHNDQQTISDLKSWKDDDDDDDDDDDEENANNLNFRFSSSAMMDDDCNPTQDFNDSETNQRYPSSDRHHQFELSKSVDSILEGTAEWVDFMSLGCDTRAFVRSLRPMKSDELHPMKKLFDSDRRLVVDASGAVDDNDGIIIFLFQRFSFMSPTSCWQTLTTSEGVIRSFVEKTNHAINVHNSNINNHDDVGIGSVGEGGFRRKRHIHFIPFCDMWRMSCFNDSLESDGNQHHNGSGSMNERTSSLYSNMLPARYTENHSILSLYFSDHNWYKHMVYLGDAVKQNRIESNRRRNGGSGSGAGTNTKNSKSLHNRNGINHSNSLHWYLFDEESNNNNNNNAKSSSITNGHHSSSMSSDNSNPSDEISNFIIASIEFCAYASTIESNRTIPSCILRGGSYGLNNTNNNSPRMVFGHPLEPSNLKKVFLILIIIFQYPVFLPSVEYMQKTSSAHRGQSSQGYSNNYSSVSNGDNDIEEKKMRERLEYKRSLKFWSRLSISILKLTPSPLSHSGNNNNNNNINSEDELCNGVNGVSGNSGRTSKSGAKKASKPFKMSSSYRTPFLDTVGNDSFLPMCFLLVYRTICLSMDPKNEEAKSKLLVSPIGAMFKYQKNRVGYQSVIDSTLNLFSTSKSRCMRSSKFLSWISALLYFMESLFCSESVREERLNSDIPVDQFHTFIESACEESLQRFIDQLYIAHNVLRAWSDADT